MPVLRIITIILGMASLVLVIIRCIVSFFRKDDYPVIGTLRIGDDIEDGPYLFLDLDQSIDVLRKEDKVIVRVSLLCPRKKQG